jgi:hypothetical protein
MGKQSVNDKDMAEQKLKTDSSVQVSGSTVQVGGNIVGRNMVIHGDHVQGDKVGGDPIRLKTL